MQSHKAKIEINLDRICHNYRFLKDSFSGDECGAVVKADAYGLGAKAVSTALFRAGVKNFFVTNLEEAIELRENFSAIFPNEKTLPKIYVINGIFPKQKKEFEHFNLCPILNSPNQIELAIGLNSALHVDSGMHRLGLNGDEISELINNKSILKKSNIEMIISHLSCAGENLNNQKNQQQLSSFKQTIAKLKNVMKNLPKISLCNSAGIFLNKEFHFNLARPGCSLYGIEPISYREIPSKKILPDHHNIYENIKNNLQNPVSLTAPIINFHRLTKDDTIGYGATHLAKKNSVIANVAIGYADGMHRLMGNNSFAVFYADKPIKLPIIGRTTMDIVSLDVTKIPEKFLDENAKIEFIGDYYNVNDMANDCNMLAYEIFTSIGANIGNRVEKIYCENAK